MSWQKPHYGIHKKDAYLYSVGASDATQNYTCRQQYNVRQPAARTPGWLLTNSVFITVSPAAPTFPNASEESKFCNMKVRLLRTKQTSQVPGIGAARRDWFTPAELQPERPR